MNNFNIDNIPDLNILTNDIIEIIEYVNNNPKLELETIKFELINKYEKVPVSIIKLLTLERDKNKQAENIKYLLELLNNLQKVKNKTLSYDNCKELFSNIIAERYIYPQFGGKENFEQHTMIK